MLRRVVRHLRFRLNSLVSPKPASATDLLLKEFLRDFELCRDYSAFETGTVFRLSSDISDANLEALISIEYHRLEKGLSHVRRRDSFGADAAHRLEQALSQAHLRGLHTPITTYAAEVLKSYHQVLKGIDTPVVGWKTLTREAVLTAGSIDPQAFFSSRHSIRCFDASQPVSIDRIREAVRLASLTPSVCNRQTWRVLICQSEHAKAAALSLQNGNKGFGHLASHVLIVASDRACFASIGERNQPWIEGGLYAMSLVYALHALGLGTCCLNWSVDNQRDAELKQALAIPASYAIAMMIAVGSLPDIIPVAESRRLHPDDLLEIL